MRSVMRGVGTMAFLAMLSVACTAGDLLGPDPSSDSATEGQVRVSLTVSAETIDPPGTVVATLTYENLGVETVELSSSYGCLSFASVYQGQHRVPFPATDYGCTAAFSSRDLEPGQPIEVRWPLVIGGEDGVPAAPGVYRFVADLNTHPFDLERTFIVR